MTTTPDPTTAATTPRPGSRAAAHADLAVQRLADASIWLLFRINRVRS